MVITININPGNITKHCLGDLEKTWNNYQKGTHEPELPMSMLRGILLNRIHFWEIRQFIKQLINISIYSRKNECFKKHPKAYTVISQNLIIHRWIPSNAVPIIADFLAQLFHTTSGKLSSTVCISAAQSVCLTVCKLCRNMDSLILRTQLCEDQTTSLHLPPPLYSQSDLPGLQLSLFPTKHFYFVFQQ